MSKNEYNKVGLYDHNLNSYKKIKKTFNNGEKVVGIVHATGTGKTYNALQLAYDNKDKKIIYITPSNAIIEHVKNLINDNPNLDLEKDFSNLEFRTYTSLVNLSHEEIENLEAELLILDEFHHIGAPVWGYRINELIETHPDINVFGMTAYTIRDRGTAYERDMANPDANELFSNKIVSRYDLCDAMMEGVLPISFSYRSAFTLAEIDDGLIDKLENKINNLSNLDSTKYKELLKDCKKRISSSKGIKDVVTSTVSKDGKYIYFCPIGAVDGINDIDTIKEEVKSWFDGIISEDDMVFYSTTSEMGEEGKLNREAFYYDKTLNGKSALGKLRIMFAINQYNEGIHAPNIDGVIMGRYTSSDIVYFEQLGRALSVSNTNSDKLPMIIDLANNHEFIKELETNLRARVKGRRSNINFKSKEININDIGFDVQIENESLYETLKYLKERLAPTTWDEMYSLAKNYYDHYGDLEVPPSFKTKNGYDPDNNGNTLGTWTKTQRDFYQQGCLSTERKELLDLIGMRFDTNKFEMLWKKYYDLSKSYYEHHGNLEIPTRFKTKNGYEYDENGIKLGNWIRTQRVAFKEGCLYQDRKELLEQIGMRLDNSAIELGWQAMYNLAKSYYEHNGNLEVPSRFKTKNGYEYDKNGKGLGNWIRSQKRLEKEQKLSREHKKLLDEIGMDYNIRELDKQWQEMYQLAKLYYEHHDNLKIPQTFKTKNGYEYDEDGKNLGSWMVTQRVIYGEGRLPEEKEKLLLNIGARLKLKDLDDAWKETFDLAKNYCQYYGNSEIPTGFVTKDGINYDEEGKKLGKWIINQRTDKRQGKLHEDREQMLKSIGIRLEPIRKVYNSITFCEENGIDKELNKDVINRITYKEISAKTNYLRANGIEITEEGKLHEIYSMSSPDMKQKYGLDLETMINSYSSVSHKSKGV